MNIALHLQESRNIRDASETNHLTELGNELLNNINSPIHEIDSTVMGVESRQANSIKDEILLRQDHLYQVIQVLAQLQISLGLTNEDQKTLSELKDSFIAIFHNLNHLYYTPSLGTDFTNFTMCLQSSSVILQEDQTLTYQKKY